MILFVLLWCLGFQDASWPELPPKLNEDEALREQLSADSVGKRHFETALAMLGVATRHKTAERSDETVSDPGRI